MFAKTRPLLAVLVVAAALVASCKCGKEKVAKEKPPPAREVRIESTVSGLPAAGRNQVLQVIPSGTSFVLFSPDAARAGKWFTENKTLASLRRTDVWRDLQQAGPAWLVSTLRHRLARLSKVSLGDWSLESLLATPTVLARYQATKERQDGAWLLVKQIDLRLQAVDRLAEALNQVDEKSKQLGSFDWEGLKVRTLLLGGKKYLYYAVFSNLLLVCNHKQTLVSALFLATGREGRSLLDIAGLGQTLQQRATDSLLLVWANLELLDQGAMWNWSPGLVPGREVIFHLPAAQPRQPGLVVGPVTAQAGGKLDESLWKILPADSRLVVASALLHLGKGKPTGEKTSVVPAGLASFHGQAALVLGGLEMKSEGPPLVHAAVLLKPSPGNWRDTDARAVMDFVFGKGLQQVKTGDAVSYRSAAPGRPGGMLLDGWLVLASTGHMLEMMASTQAGQGPCLADWPGFTKSMDGGRGPVLLVADADKIFADLSAYAAWLDGQRQLAAGQTLAGALGPFLAACRQGGRMGLLLQQHDGLMAGNLRMIR